MLKDIIYVKYSNMPISPTELFTGKEKLVSKKTVKSIEDYFRHVNWALEHVFDKQPVWYRGHANKNYQLLPGLYRISGYNAKIEYSLKNEFLDKARNFSSFNHLNEFEWAFLMQHYGLPTRLLDWTEAYLIALFFSLKLNQNDNAHIDPCVWMVNPLELNQIVSHPAKLLRINDTDDQKILIQYFNLTPETKDRMPIAISSTYSNERILRQRGCFTIHGTEQVSIDSVYRRHKNSNIVQIIIDGKSRSKISIELEKAGISESSIFPDLEGLARELRRKYLTSRT